MATDSPGFHQEAEAPPREKDVCETILESLKGNGVSRVVLAGKAGIGKTWVASEACKRATKKDGLCYLALWLHLNKKFDERSLYEDIAAQLSLFHEYEETEDDDGKEKEEEEELDNLKKNIIKEIQKKKASAQRDKKSALSGGGKKSAAGGNAGGEKKPASSAGEKKPAKGEKNFAEGDKTSASPAGEKYLLLILNDEGSVTEEGDLMNELKLRDFLEPYGPLKILITRRKGDDSSKNRHEEMKSPTASSSREIEAATESRTENSFQASPEPVTKDETQALLDSLTEDEMRVLLESLIKIKSNLLEEKWGNGDSTLKSTIVRKSLCLPAAVVVLAKSLNCIALDKEAAASDPSRHEYVKKVFREVVPWESHDAAAGSENTTNPFNCILHLGFELLKSDDKWKDAMVDCFWHSLDFFKHSGCVYYRVLISHWILEGYFDVKSVEKAYQDGHRVLMELINRGILKIQENNVVVPEVAMSNLIDLRDRGFFGTSRLGFSRVYGSDKTKGLGRITVIDDMIKTVRTNKKGEKLSTILVSENRLRRESPNKFFEKEEMKDLEVLGLFEPTLKSLVPSLSKLNKLRVLVIRDFDLLENIDKLDDLKRLQVLEVSGASSLKNIPDDFFKAMRELQSLNLSGLRIKSSPSTISDLTKLRCLILRDCPELEDLPDVQSLEKLEVIDFRGARELKTCFDKEKGIKKNKSKNKNFYRLQKLQLLDFSESQIERLPIFQDSSEVKELHSVNRLLLRNCSKLRRLPNLKPLSGLQVLDLSGTTGLVEMLEVCFEEKKQLRILNLSGTNLSELPSTISELSNLTQFLLMDCPNLEALPNIEELTSLEEFDVSGCTKLEKIEGSFKRMSYLRKLNLCGSRIKPIPELPERSSLRCSKYIVLPDSRREEGEDWRQIKKALPSGMFERCSSSDAGAKTSEIAEKESGLGETHSNEPHTYGCPEKKDECEDPAFHSRYDALCEKAGLLIDPKSSPEIIKFHRSKSSDPSGFSAEARETITNAARVFFVESCSTSISSVFEAFQMTSVKKCWVNRCKKMENLFSGEYEKHVELLETLWVSNLPLLKSLHGESPEHGKFRNLKKLSIDCCPSLTTFLLPASLEVLHIKFCDKLEKVFVQDVEVPNLQTLHLVELPVLSPVGVKLPKLKKYNEKNCPKFEGITPEQLRKGITEEDLIIVHHNDAAP